MDNAKLHPRFVDAEGDLVLSRSVITNNLILGRNLFETQAKKSEDSEQTSEVLEDVTEAIPKEDDSREKKVNSTVQYRTVTSGDGDTDAL